VTDLLAAVDALALEVRGHPDVGDDHLWFVPIGGGHERFVVHRGTDDLDAFLSGQHGPDAFADDQAVVGHQHADALVPHDA